MKEKISLQDLSVLLAEKSAITKKEAETFLREYFEIMNEELIKSGLLKIKDLGTFKLSLMENRESIDVTTGERVLIPAHYKVAFTPDKKLTEIVNEPFAFFETTEINDESILEELKLFPEYNIPEELEPFFEEEVENISINEPILDEEEAVLENEPTPDKEEIILNNEAVPNNDDDIISEVSNSDLNLENYCLKCKEFEEHRIYREKYFKARQKIKRLRLVIFILCVFLVSALGYLAYLMIYQQNILKIF